MHGGTLDISILSPQQRASLDALLDELLDLPDPERLTALGRRAVDDPVVAEAAKEWLGAVHASSDFLSASAGGRCEELPDAALGLRLGAWRLTRLIGRGGMGDVYEAVRADGEFDQRVAIKILQGETAGESRRFQAERQILARLQHAHIARLYDGGVMENNRLYMVMEYVEGRPITDFCAHRESALPQRLALFIQVCEAVSFAHRNHVIHRDLKPSNILVTSDSTVKLLDFGIAQFSDAKFARITQAVATPMTPICAAPEQLTGGETSPATDVYALGLLLFELLTGVHPWMNRNAPILQAMRTVLERPAPLASRTAEALAAPPVAVRKIRGDLDAIIAKTLRKEPAQRYATAEALRADVERFLRGEPVEARKHARLYVASHLLKRYRWPLAATMAGLALVVSWRTTRAPPQPSSVGNAVAMLGFTNLSRQDDVSWLGTALSEMISTEMSVARDVRVVPRQLVTDVAKGLKSSGEPGYDPQTLRTLAQHAGADYLVSGDFLVGPARDDPELRVDVVLQSTRTGTSVARFSQRGALSSLPDLVNKIGITLRGKLGGAAPSVELREQIAKAQPPSMDVAQKLSSASQAMQRYDAAKARDELLQVVAESPGFAPAYLSLSDAWSALGYREKAVAAAQQSVAHESGLPREMQLQIDAVLQATTYQWSNAAADWQALVKLKPADPEYRLQVINTSLAAGAPGAARAALAELRHLPEAAQDPRVELAAARISCALDDAKACADHARAALRLALSLETPGLAADARNQLAIALTHLGDPQGAVDNLRVSIDAYRAIANPRGEAEAHRELGRALFDQHQDDDARAEYQRSMAIGQSIGDLGGVSAVYRNLAELLWQGGDLDGAQAAAQRGLELSRETGDLKLQAWTLRALATIAANDSASEEVMQDYREVTALTQRSGDLGGHVWSLATYADMERLRGAVAEAQTDCVQALSEAARLTDPQFMVYSGYACALVEMDSGHVDTAEEMLKRVESASEASKNTIYLANARLTLSQIDFERSHCDKALPRLDSAITGFAQFEASTGEAEAESLRAACYQQIGDLPRRDAALARVRTLRTAITSPLEMYGVDIVTAQLGYEKGQHRDAIARLNAMAAEAARRHWLRWSLEARLAAWELAQASGDRPYAQQLRRNLEKSAREHEMGRILARIQQPTT